jgi:hypothetical protein
MTPRDKRPIPTTCERGAVKSRSNSELLSLYMDTRADINNHHYAELYAKELAYRFKPCWLTRDIQVHVVRGFNQPSFFKELFFWPTRKLVSFTWSKVGQKRFLRIVYQEVDKYEKIALWEQLSKDIVHL